jgi:hypothetical protein
MKLNNTSLSLMILFIFTGVSWITSCTHDAKINDLPEVCFKRDVLPIFETSCAINGCHSGGGEGMALNSYTNISRSIVPGNPNSSSAYSAITSTWGENKMPPQQPLSLENRTIIRIWIEQGAGETTCTIPVGSGKAKESSAINGKSTY